jgi:phosphatidylserine decarboxylase
VEIGSKALGLRKSIPPLHPDGFKFVAAGALATLILFLLWAPVGWIALIATGWIAYFFRDPWRVTPLRAGVLVSPADGVVAAIAPASPPPELEMDAGPMARISIFLSVFDVHVNRMPVAGRVAALRYRKGRFVDARHDEASLHNERMAIRIVPAEGPPIVFVQIAGAIARRIVCDLYEGQEVAVGQRMGIIRFGSRVDVYCPPPYMPLVAVGQRVIGGETVIADRLAAAEPGEAFAH